MKRRERHLEWRSYQEFVVKTPSSRWSIDRKEGKEDDSTEWNSRDRQRLSLSLELDSRASVHSLLQGLLRFASWFPSPLTCESLSLLTPYKLISSTFHDVLIVRRFCVFLASFSGWWSWGGNNRTQEHLCPFNSCVSFIWKERNADKWLQSRYFLRSSQEKVVSLAGKTREEEEERLRLRAIHKQRRILHRLLDRKSLEHTSLIVFFSSSFKKMHVRKREKKPIHRSLTFSRHSGVRS